MTHTGITVEMLERSLGMLQKALADFTDADMLVRTVENANHAQWMLGHLCVSEVRMMSSIKPAFASLLPAGFADRFPQVKDRVNDVAWPLPKSELWPTYESIRQGTIELAKSLTDADLLRAIPSPFNPGSQTTVGFMMNMPALHSTLHLGQIQVIRRKLGKPLLF